MMFQHSHPPADRTVLLGYVTAESLLRYLMGETDDPCDPLYNEHPCQQPISTH